MNESVRPGAVVLVDTNVIIEAHRTGTWAALAGAYAVETVEDCVTETQTGYQRRARERWIEVGVLTMPGKAMVPACVLSKDAVEAPVCGR